MIRTPRRTRVPAPAIGVLLAAMLGMGVAGPAAAVELSYLTPGTYNFVVPPGVTEIGVVARGGGGGNGSGYGGLGGSGGRAEATMAVTPGETILITVGAGGQTLGAPYYAPIPGGAGGGASDVRRGGGSLADRIIVAAGGGGGGGGLDENHPGGPGGTGGGLVGGNGSAAGTIGGGSGGTETAGGLGGSGAEWGGSGAFGTGGWGGFYDYEDYPSGGQGGGGGGGYFGGGGGGGGISPDGGGGGGGGSGLVPEGGVLIAGGGGPAGAAGSVTLSFEARELSVAPLDGGAFSVVVPASVTEVEVVALGAGGGGSNGGAGGRAEGVLTVSPGETLFFNVGGRGKLESGGFNGGGDGGQGGVIFNACCFRNITYGAGGGGGGATDVRQGGSTPAHRVIVAGGGGGGASTFGGSGGGLIGDDGTDSYCAHAGGGGQSVCGANSGSGGTGSYGAGGGGGGLCGGYAGAAVREELFCDPVLFCYNNYCLAAGGGGGSGLVPEGGTLTTGGGSPAGQSGSITLIMRCSPVAMSLDFTPNTLNLQSMGHWVTATLEPEPPITPEDIDVASILLNGSVPVDGSGPISIGDADGDGLPDLTVKFDRAAVELVVEEGDAVPVTVTGSAGGGCFEAMDVIKVKRAHVTAPVAGSVYSSGSTAEVRWTTPSGIDIESVAILSSTDDGISWSLDASGLPNTGSADWVVPSTATDQGRVAIVLVESSDETGYIVDGVMGTSGAFSIETVTGVEDLGKAVFALRRVVPNPAHDRLGVAFSLPDGRSPARLEIYSVSGRLVASREVGYLGPGAHTVTLGERARLASGVYIVRLTQAGKSLTTRAVVVR